MILNLSNGNTINVDETKVDNPSTITAGRAFIWGIRLNGPTPAEFNWYGATDYAVGDWVSPQKFVGPLDNYGVMTFPVVESTISRIESIS